MYIIKYIIIITAQLLVKDVHHDQRKVTNYGCSQTTDTTDHPRKGELFAMQTIALSIDPSTRHLDG